MAKLTVSQGIEIVDGAYEATLLGVEQCQPTDKSPNQKPWLKWTFSVFDGAEEKEMTAASSCALGPKAKARGWIEALVGRRLEPGEEIDTDTLAPKDCQLIIKNDPETQFAKVQDVLPPRPRRQVTKAVAQAASDGVTV
jgi:hypothetical protein